MLALIAGALVVFAAGRLLERGRPALHIRQILMIAFGVRVLAAFAVSNLSAAQSLRGGDEIFFVHSAQALARWSTISWHALDTMTKKFHIFAFSLDFQVF